MKRRVKCDETKSVCLRCKRSNRQCAAYNFPSIFRHTDFVDAFTNKSSSQTVSSSSQEEARQDPEFDALQDRKPSDELKLFQYTSNIPQDFTLAAFANNLYASFLVNTFWASNSSVRNHASSNHQWFMKCLTEQADGPTSFLVLIPPSAYQCLLWYFLHFVPCATGVHSATEA